MLTWLVREHLRRVGPVLLGFTVLAAALPVLSLRPLLASGIGIDSMMVISSAAAVAPAYPLLAFIVGAVVGLTAWSSDTEGAHVYALTLPIPRWNYALLRLAAALVLLVPVVAGLAFTASVLGLTVGLPPGLHLYPLALVIRFTGAMLVSFSVLFALGAGGSRAGVIAILGLIGIVFIDLIMQVASGRDYSPLFNLLLGAGSPLTFFSGIWSIIDV